MKKSNRNFPKTGPPTGSPEQTEAARDAAVYRAALKKAQREKTMDWETLKKELKL